MPTQFFRSLLLGSLVILSVSTCGKNNPPDDRPKPHPVPTPKPPVPPPVPDDADDTPPGFLTQDQVVQQMLAMRSRLIELPAEDPLIAEHIESVKNAGDFTKNLRTVTYDLGTHTGMGADARTSRDLRRFDTRVMNQGSRGTCTAFGTTATLENLWNRKSGGKAVNLSPEHLWSCYGRPYTQGAIGCSQKLWIVPETIWPYNTRQRVQPSQGVLNEPLWEQVETSVQGIAQSVIDDRTAVVFAFEVSQAFVRANQGVVNPFDRSVVGGHAVELVGVVRDQRLSADFGGGYFIIKNSWGGSYGDHGSGYLPFKYCETHQCYEAFKPSLEALKTR